MTSPGRPERLRLVSEAYDTLAKRLERIGLVSGGYVLVALVGALLEAHGLPEATNPGSTTACLVWWVTSALAAVALCIASFVAERMVTYGAAALGALPSRSVVRSATSQRVAPRFPRRSSCNW